MPAHVCTKVWATGHQHDGALGMELWLNGTKIFETAPSYGSEENVPGNELGFIVGDTIGSWSKPVPIADGSRLSVVSKYDSHPPAYDVSGFVSGAEVARTGVMGYLRMRVVEMAPPRESHAYRVAANATDLIES